MLDRRWMLVNANNNAVTQRECPQMALLQVQLTQKGLRVSSKNEQNDALYIPFLSRAGTQVHVRIFGQVCEAQFVCATADDWFSQKLGAPYRLVYMPDSSIRQINKKYASTNEIVSFSDEFPYLLIGQSSLDDLNKRLSEPLPMDRFRPNIVFTGGTPYQEDDMEQFTINNLRCLGVSLCGRCVITTINQANGSKAKEPLKTLATYRIKNNRTNFGLNVLIYGEGTINTGDEIIIHKLSSPGSGD